MDIWQPFIPFSSKSYNKYGRIILAVTFVLAAILVGVGYDLKEKDDFRCNPKKAIAADLVAKNYVTMGCYINYERKHHPSIPVSRFIVINFGLILVISVAYAGIVNSKVEKYDTASGQNMEEPWQLDNLRDAQVFVFPLYIIHLFLARLAPLILFIVLLRSVSFPVEFQCEWQQDTSGVLNAKNYGDGSNFTIVECINPLGGKFETLTTSVFVIDCAIAAFGIIEIVYLLKHYRLDNDFGNDIEFCYIYLLEKRGVTIRQILKRIRKTIMEDEHLPTLNLNSDFKPYRGSYMLDDLRFQFLLHEEIERKSFQRHEIYNVYLDQDQDKVKNRLVHLFPLKNDNYESPLNGATNPGGIITTGVSTNPEILEICGKILLVGRAGIGKTTVAKVLFYRWAKCAFLENRVVFLLTFQTFRKDRPTTLKKMLRQAKGMPSRSAFEELYRFILVNPKKIVLIFDGLDDINASPEKLDDDSTNDYQKPMSIFTIFIKLLKDQFLPGATVITTSRCDKAENISNEFSITFQKRLELLGFCRRDIENYVKGFCVSETDTCAKIWKTVKNHPEFLSLCYVPQVCDLVCSTLKECFEHSKTDKDIAMFVPKTTTELYQRAIRVIIWETLRYRYTSAFGTRGYLTSDIPQSFENYMGTLKRLAKSKLESREISFQLEAKDLSQRIVSCGLVTPLTEGYYRFLHTTMQEFLAAHHIVDKMKDTGDVMQFLSSLKNYLEEPGWHLVIQFVFGLLGEKMRKKKIDIPKENICKSLLQWIRFLTPYREIKDAKKTGRKAARTPDKNEKRVAILVIKFLHEMQDVEMIKMCGREVDGGGPNNICYLNGLDITSIDCTGLLQFLVFVKFLTKLTLSDNQISGLWCLGLAKLLNENVNLTQIDLIRTSLNDEDIKILCDNINAKNRRGMNLHLGVNQVTANGVETLRDSIVEKKLNLTCLSLNVNAIMVEGAKALSTALAHNNCNITRLNLYKCGMGNEGVIALCAALKHEDCKLVDLDLSNNNVNYEGVRSLCDLLKLQTARLTHLALRRNSLTARDIEPLRDVLRNNLTLTNLDLSANTLGDAGAECLYRGLTGVNSGRLENLSVGRNEVESRGIKLLSDALKSENCGLKRLNLAWSKIGDVGMKHICDALKDGNCQLTSLDLSCNEINQTGLQYLCLALQSSNCKIVNLHLSSNNLTDQDRKLLSDSFKVAARQNPNRGNLVTIS